VTRTAKQLGWDAKAHLSSLVTERIIEKSEKKNGSCALHMFLNQPKELLEEVLLEEVLLEGEGGGRGSADWEEVGEGGVDDATGGGAVMLWWGDLGCCCCCCCWPARLKLRTVNTSFMLLL
jgi:hypothetical protein